MAQRWRSVLQGIKTVIRCRWLTCCTSPPTYGCISNRHWNVRTCWRRIQRNNGFKVTAKYWFSVCVPVKLREAIWQKRPSNEVDWNFTKSFFFFFFSQRHWISLSYTYCYCCFTSKNKQEAVQWLQSVQLKASELKWRRMFNSNSVFVISPNVGDPFLIWHFVVLTHKQWQNQTKQQVTPNASADHFASGITLRKKKDTS